MLKKLSGLADAVRDVKRRRMFADKAPDRKYCHLWSHCGNGAAASFMHAEAHIPAESRLAATTFGCRRSTAAAAAALSLLLSSPSPSLPSSALSSSS